MSDYKWLVRKNPRKNGYGELVMPKSHIWVDSKNNTLCNMYSNGGFDKEQWDILDVWKYEKCQMCLKKNRKLKIIGQ